MKRRRVALLVLSVALSGCASGPRLIPVPSAAPSAAPGAPGLLVRLDVESSTNRPGVVRQHAADYLTDGTVVRVSDAGGQYCSSVQSCGTLERNTLTATGLDALHEMLDKDADLLAEPMAYKSRTAPNTQPFGRGERIYTFVLERGDGSRYAVSIPSLESPDAATWIPDPAIERLNVLAEAMQDPETLVGAGGLANPAWTTYQPDWTAVFVSFEEVDRFVTTTGLSADISSTWPFEQAPDVFGAAFDGPSGIKRCAFLPSADVMTAIAALPRQAGTALATPLLTAGFAWHSGGLAWLARSNTIGLALAVVPLMPEDAGTSCAYAIAY